MSLFNSILEQITKNLSNKELNKSYIAKELNTITGIDIDPNNISIKNNSIILDISPTIKSVILLKKDKILKVLSKYSISSIQ